MDALHPRVLHIFERACNLINERGDVLSIVTPEIGNGPFNLVVETDFLFNEYLNVETPISVSAHRLHLGDLIVHSADAKPWNPRPAWELLHSKKDRLVTALLKLPITAYRFSNPAFAIPSAAFANRDLFTARGIASKLAGLGIGLTPAGDDFLVGALYAAWIIHPPGMASAFAREVAESAAPLTTSLSAAWLRAAGRGEAGILWHQFFDALISDNIRNSREAMQKILAVGETSGADALSGFMGVLTAYHEKELTAHEDSSR